MITRREIRRRVYGARIAASNPAMTLMPVFNATIHERARREGATSTRTVMIRGSVAHGKRKLASLQTALDVTSLVRRRGAEVEGARSPAMSVELRCDHTRQPPSSPGTPPVNPPNVSPADSRRRRHALEEERRRGSTQRTVSRDLVSRVCFPTRCIHTRSGLPNPGLGQCM